MLVARNLLGSRLSGTVFLRPRRPVLDAVAALNAALRFFYDHLAVILFRIRIGFIRVAVLLRILVSICLT